MTAQSSGAQELEARDVETCCYLVYLPVCRMHMFLQAETEATHAPIDPGFTGITDYIFGREMRPNSQPIASPPQPAHALMWTVPKGDVEHSPRHGKGTNRSNIADEGAQFRGAHSNALTSERGGTGVEHAHQSAAANSDLLTLSLWPSTDSTQHSHSPFMTAHNIQCSAESSTGMQRRSPTTLIRFL